MDINPNIRSSVFFIVIELESFRIAISEKHSIVKERVQKNITYLLRIDYQYASIIKSTSPIYLPVLSFGYELVVIYLTTGC